MDEYLKICEKSGCIDSDMSFDVRPANGREWIEMACRKQEDAPSLAIAAAINKISDPSLREEVHMQVTVSDMQL